MTLPLCAVSSSHQDSVGDDGSSTETCTVKEEADLVRKLAWVRFATTDNAAVIDRWIITFLVKCTFILQKCVTCSCTYVVEYGQGKCGTQGGLEPSRLPIIITENMQYCSHSHAGVV